MDYNVLLIFGMSEGSDPKAITVLDLHRISPGDHQVPLALVSE